MVRGFSEQCPGKLKRYIEFMLNDSLKAYDITSAYVPYLMILSANEGISLKEISEIVGLDRAHTTRVMSKLLDKGLAENISTNNKQYSVRLTEKGHEIVSIIKKETSSIMDDLLSCLTVEERDQWESLWQKINEKMSK